ncbi:hypothetical protein [Thalassovita gelatinovora]|uniref:hypothetical protein n=1 Tax=Thalassovita gelatinovora TaxID=53501 RepID=UPI000B0FB61B|nr:hypothetical protein [Thalassovita gelatinovora]QIZ78970.1 hypothetical protein HFZ77_09075 [Thalassovita gelatinovora]
MADGLGASGSGSFTTFGFAVGAVIADPFSHFLTYPCDDSDEQFMTQIRDIGARGVFLQDRIENRGYCATGRVMDVRRVQAAEKPL